MTSAIMRTMMDVVIVVINYKIQVVNAMDIRKLLAPVGAGFKLSEIIVDNTVHVAINAF